MYVRLPIIRFRFVVVEVGLRVRQNEELHLSAAAKWPSAASGRHVQVSEYLLLLCLRQKSDSLSNK